MDDDVEQENSAPSPKFISIQNSMEMKQIKSEKPDSIDVLDRIDKIPENQLKTYHEVSFAE